MKFYSHPSVVTIEASARLNFAKISPSSTRGVSSKSKEIKKELEKGIFFKTAQEQT